MMISLSNIISAFFYKVVNSNEYITLVQSNVSIQKTSIISQFKRSGINIVLPDDFIIKNPQYISIGDGFTSMYNLRLEAWDAYRQQRFLPEILIGNNVIVNTDVHIGCINRIVIGDNVLIASRVYISDHSHGNIDVSELEIPPTARDLVSKGPVIIEDNVWIGEGVCIMPGVTIGKNSIIGANAVVTKSIPQNAIAAGVPAKVIRVIVDAA
jgi:NDP-sugar pyrophosphorylase family protein